MISVHFVDAPGIEVVVKKREVLVWVDDQSIVLYYVRIIKSELQLLRFGCGWHEIISIYDIELADSQQVRVGHSSIHSQ